MGEPPLLFMAAGCEDRLAAYIRQLVRRWPEGSVINEAAAAVGRVSSGAVAVAWAALQLLPHSCQQWQEVCP